MGPLPDSFLRIEERNAQLQQEAADQQAALALQQQMQNMPVTHDPRVGRLSVTISQVISLSICMRCISRLIDWNKPTLRQPVLSRVKKLFFSGQISEKLWNDKNGSLREVTSGTFSVWDTYRLKWWKKSTLEQSDPVVRMHIFCFHIFENTYICHKCFNIYLIVASFHLELLKYT